MGQKASILGHRAQSFKKLYQRRKEEEKAANDSEIAIEKVHLEVQKELKQLSDANLKREQEQQQVIHKLEEQAKESCSLVKGLRCDLEDARGKMLMLDNRVDELETRVLEEQKASSAITKRAEELEAEILRVRKQLETEIDAQRVWKELQDEKAAREEAWARIAALEQEMKACIEGAWFGATEIESRKRQDDACVRTETHLRDLHWTTEQMKELFGRQQDELQEMQVSLADAAQEIHQLPHPLDASAAPVTDKPEPPPMLLLQTTPISN